MVNPNVEDELRHVLLASNMCILIPESEVETTPDGRLLLAGLFAVPHKVDTDRLIVDKRPANWGDTSFGWAKLTSSGL